MSSTLTGLSMRRSAQVFAPILATAAMALSTGCNTTDPQRCVDEQNRVVDPKFCANLPPGAVTSGTTANGGGEYRTNSVFYPHIYRNYYGGNGGSGLGSTVLGGSYLPEAGHSYSFSSGTSRGGFGSSFSGGEGGGE